MFGSFGYYKVAEDQDRKITFRNARTIVRTLVWVWLLVLLHISSLPYTIAHSSLHRKDDLRIAFRPFVRWRMPGTDHIIHYGDGDNLLYGDGYRDRPF